MVCRSKVKPVEAREAWTPCDGVVALGWDNGVLLVDMQRRKATWRGERLRFSDMGLDTLYRLAVGILLRGEGCSCEHHLRMVRRKMAGCGDFWTVLRAGRYHLVQGWDAEKGLFVPPPEPVDIGCVAPWKREIEKPAPRAPRREPDSLDGHQKATVLNLSMQGYRPVAIAAVTRFPYKLIADCVTQHFKTEIPCDRKALVDRPVTPSHATSREMSRFTAEDHA